MLKETVEVISIHKIMFPADDTYINIMWNKYLSTRFRGFILRDGILPEDMMDEVLPGQLLSNLNGLHIL